MFDTLMVTDHKKKDVTIKMEREIYEQLQQVLDERNKDIKNTVGKIVSHFTEKEKLLEVYPAYMSIVSVRDNEMIIKDNKQNIYAGVKLRYTHKNSNEVELYCDNCKSDYCPHVAFANGSNELGQLHLNLKKTR